MNPGDSFRVHARDAHFHALQLERSLKRLRDLAPNRRDQVTAERLHGHAGQFARVLGKAARGA